MSLLKDRQAFRYVIFLLLFVFLSFAMGIGGTFLYSVKVKKIHLDWKACMVSSLLEQEVRVQAVSTALKNTEISEEGTVLLGKLGHSQDTQSFLFSEIKKEQICLMILWGSITVLLMAVLLIGSFLFLYQREKVYQNAVKIAGEYQKGNYCAHLPWDGTGTLYQLFQELGKTASCLKSMHEAEQKTKEYLKDCISDISHQLKTPLSALQMYIEIIEGEYQNEKVVEKFIKKSHLSVGKMENLIQSLLKAMRLEAGSIVFECTQCKVKELAEQAVADLKVRACKEEKQIIIKGDPKDSLFCDLGWTSEAVENLVKNALDHTDRGGRVEISWKKSFYTLHIIVADNGTGISENDIYHIFKRFYRSRSSADIQGVGLGLPLAKSIVEGQNGQITVESKPHEGTKFTLSFLTKM